MRDADEASPSRRLADLRRAQPVDSTLQNLLALLTTKLDLCARLPVFEWEAESEGHDGCATALRAFAEAERRSCHDVIDCLRLHLEQTTRARAGSAALDTDSHAVDGAPC
jgi:hypothetical protein